MSSERLKNGEKRVIGVKQTLKSIEKSCAKLVFVAHDADSMIVQPITEACVRNGVVYESIPTMQELGKLCGIHVGAAAAAILKD